MSLSGNKRGCIFLITLWLIVFTPRAFAGNPLYMASEGNPLVWDTSNTIKFRVDPKGLGKLDFAKSLAIVRYAMSRWEEVSGPNIKFEYLGTTQESITIDNWKEIAGNTLYAEGYGIVPTGTSAAQTEHAIVIGFDNTGEIIKAKGSFGATGVESVTGVAGTYDNPKHIISAHVFINGLYYNGSDSDEEDLSLADLVAVVTHELGHVLGLDHSLVDYRLYKDILSGELDVSNARYLPTMFPRFIRGTGEYAISLHPDDMATIKWMYGSEDILMAAGEVIDESNNPLPTLVVTARARHSSLCEVYSQASSVLCSKRNTAPDGSGSPFFNAKNCADEDAQGTYAIPMLAKGDYTLDVQEIPDIFVQAIARFGGKTNAMAGDAEFYNTNDDANEDPHQYSVVRIKDEDRDHIDLVLDARPDSQNTKLERISYEYFAGNEFFGIPDDDEFYCPITPDLDLEANIAALMTDAPEANTSAYGMNFAATGCSLHPFQNASPAYTATPAILAVGLFLLISLRLTPLVR